MNNSPYSTIRELLEQVRDFDEKIELPDVIAFNRHHQYAFHIDKVKKEVEQYNKFSMDSKESSKNLKVLTRTLISFVEEMYKDRLDVGHHHSLELKKKDYVIKGLKDFISSKDSLDDEIPTDDDDSKDGKTEKDPKGLSKKELDLIKKFKV